MTFTEEQAKEISDFLNKKIKKCPVCHGHHFELVNWIDYQECLVNNESTLLPCLLLNCENCGFIMEFFAIRTGLFKLSADSTELVWYKDNSKEPIEEPSKEPMGKILPFKKIESQ